MTFIGGALIRTPLTISVLLGGNRFISAFTSSSFNPNTAVSYACNDAFTATYVKVPSGSVIGTATVTTFGGDSITLSLIYYFSVQNGAVDKAFHSENKEECDGWFDWTASYSSGKSTFEWWNCGCELSASRPVLAKLSRSTVDAVSDWNGSGSTSNFRIVHMYSL